MSANEIVHNILKSEYKNEIVTIENEVVYDSLERDKDTRLSTHVRPASFTQRDAQQKQANASSKKKQQYQSNKITIYTMTRGQNNCERRGDTSIKRYLIPQRGGGSSPTPSPRCAPELDRTK